MKQRGYALIYVMIVMAGFTIAMGNEFIKKEKEKEESEGKVIGEQIKNLGIAIDQYLMSGHSILLKQMKDDICYGVAGCNNDGKWFCRPLNTDQCVLDLNVLVQENLMPPGWNQLNIVGSTYKTVITRVPKDPTVVPAGWSDYNLRAITVTTAPLIKNGSVDYKKLTIAAKYGGDNVGISTSNGGKGNVRKIFLTETSGKTISWNATIDMNPDLNKEGLLMVRSGFEANSSGYFNGLVPLDGSRAMKGNLDLGRNRINNVSDIYVKNIAGGRNVSSVLPNWVFKYSWRVKDGDVLPKPDCSVDSAGLEGVAGGNPWEKTSKLSLRRDLGVPRVLLVNDYMGNLKSLGYFTSDSRYGATEINNYVGGLGSLGLGVESSNPGKGPWDAYAPDKMVRARGAYTFYAQDLGVNWQVHMKYFQDGTTNTAVDANMSKGIASIYCYYDNSSASACNGESGCQAGGVKGSGIASSDLTKTALSSTVDPDERFTTAGSTAGLKSEKLNTIEIGAADFEESF